VLGGKTIAAALVCGAIYGLSSFVGTAHAEEAAAVAPYINPINTLWTLVAAFLVFFMQAGFMMLEAGFARGRETVNILLEGIVDTALCGILFWAFGFAFLFGSDVCRVEVRIVAATNQQPPLLVIASCAGSSPPACRARPRAGLGDHPDRPRS
jgi:hypothetical protein